MNFENAMVAMRKGYAVCRTKSLERANGIYYIIDKHGSLQTKSMAGGGGCSMEEGLYLRACCVMANDWTIYRGERNG